MSTLPRIPTEDIPFRLHPLRSMSMAAKRAYAKPPVYDVVKYDGQLDLLPSTRAAWSLYDHSAVNPAYTRNGAY